MFYLFNARGRFVVSFLSESNARPFVRNGWYVVTADRMTPDESRQTENPLESWLHG